MSNTFVTRVELHGAQNWQDYVTLHAAMAKEGFQRTITGDNGLVYELPTAEYTIYGNYTVVQVREKAKRAAISTGKSFAVLASQTTTSAWFGLETQKALKQA